MSHKKQWVVGTMLGLLVAIGMIAVQKVFQNDSKPIETTILQPGSDASMHSVRERFVFAPYALETSVFVPAVKTEKVSLQELGNMKNFERPVPPQDFELSRATPYAFSQTQKQSLAEKNFFVAPIHDLDYDNDPDAMSGRIDDWTQIYNKIGGYFGEFYRAPENAPFVTTDYMLHVYHRLLEKEFEHAEQTVLFDHIHTLSKQLFTKAVASAAVTTGEEKASYERLSGYFLVPLLMMESVQRERESQSGEDTKIDSLVAAEGILAKYAEKIPIDVRERVNQELKLIYESQSMERSPLLGEIIVKVNPMYFEDYTQFGPRSHYAKNSVLRSYFRSMMWFGRQNLLAASPELMRDSLAIAEWMNDPVLKKEWEAVYIPTTFFVGESDDLGIYEYQDLLGRLGNPKAFDAETVSRAQALAKTFQAPQILSSVLVGDEVTATDKKGLLESTRGFRFMGQRFTPDAFILNQLTKGQEQGPLLPSMPTALMVMSVFGDQTSDLLLNDWITKNHPEMREDILTKVTELKQKFSELPDETWGQNIYWGWTRTLKSLFQESNKLSGYPFFMKHDAWRRKDTQAALGSWTELKHDTLLYAKQSYAELGGGGDDPQVKPAVPKGYVEPNMEFWDRLQALAKMTYQGMNDLGLLDQTLQSRNEQFLDSLSFFRTMALQEIENKTISDADFERLRQEPGKLGAVIDMLPGETAVEDNARSGLIADIHTDVPGGEILYEANGKPNSIFVAVKDANGSRLTRGLVYDYYEFTGPLEKRLTDKNWRAAVYEGKPLAPEGGERISFPNRPTWTESLR